MPAATNNFYCRICHKDGPGQAMEVALRVHSGRCWNQYVRMDKRCKACGQKMPTWMKLAYERGAVISTFNDTVDSPFGNYCRWDHKVQWQERRKRERAEQARKAADRLNRLCRICDNKIDPKRIKRWPNVKTCKPECAADNRRANVREAVARHYRRQRKLYPPKPKAAKRKRSGSPSDTARAGG